MSALLCGTWYSSTENMAAGDIKQMRMRLAMGCRAFAVNDDGYSLANSSVNNFSRTGRRGAEMQCLALNASADKVMADIKDVGAVYAAYGDFARKDLIRSTNLHAIQIRQDWAFSTGPFTTASERVFCMA